MSDVLVACPLCGGMKTSKNLTRHRNQCDGILRETPKITRFGDNTMIEDLDALLDIFDDDSAAFDQRAFQDRYGDLLIVAANEHGELVYATMPTDDPESDGPFVGMITKQNSARPLVPLFPAADVEIRRQPTAKQEGAETDE